MAITPTETPIGNPYGGGIVAVDVLWETLNAANTTGVAWENKLAGDVCVQAVGTFDSATLLLQGSNDGTNWFGLNDPAGTAISLTADGMEQVLEAPRYLRPSHSGGLGSEDIDCRIYARRAAR